MSHIKPSSKHRWLDTSVDWLGFKRKTVQKEVLKCTDCLCNKPLER